MSHYSATVIPAPALDHFRGCLMGLAVGDCLGAPVEFARPGTFEPVTDLRAGGAFNLKVGEWTDDTSMALCMAESLLSRLKVDPIDMLQRWVRWHDHGHLSSIGRCFDIGCGTAAALATFKITGEPECGRPGSAGNGSIMRMAPVPMALSCAPSGHLRAAAAKSSRTTHAAQEATDAAQFFACLVSDALNDALDIDTMIPRNFDLSTLCPSVQAIALGSYREAKPPEIKASGYVLDSLSAALWAFINSLGFEEGARMAVNLGDDADTVGAIYGQLAGAYYGLEGIPAKWHSKIVQRDMILKMADDLFALPRTLRY
jgi:ADP-ribosyl-[dinitrogen reductase] hydrolase